MWFTTLSNSRSYKVYQSTNLYFFSEHERFSEFSVILTALLMVIWVSHVYLHFSFRRLSSPGGWSCQTAQTIHHLKATLRKVSALPPLLHQQHFSSSLPVCILFIFSSFLTHLSAQIDFPSHSFGSLVFILPRQATDPSFALPSSPLFNTTPACSLSL